MMSKLSLTSIFMMLPVALSAQAADKRWQIDEAARTIFVAECETCQETADINFSCPATNNMTTISIPAIATKAKAEIETGAEINSDIKPGADEKIAHITFDFFGREFVYGTPIKINADDNSYPQFDLELDDPLFKALKKGSRVRLDFMDKKMTLTLRGSQVAISQFQALCKQEPKPKIETPLVADSAQAPLVANTEENTQPQDDTQSDPILTNSTEVIPTPDETGGELSHTVLNKIAAKPDSAGNFWHTGDGYGKGSPKILSYSKAVISAPKLQVDCFDAASNNFNLKLNINFGKHKHGDPIKVDFILDDTTHSYEGRYFDLSDAPFGTEFLIPRNDPIWRNIAKSKFVTFGSRDAEIQTANGISGAPAIHEFLKACGDGTNT